MREGARTGGAPSELPLLLGPGKSTPESLFLLGAPGADGVLHVRIWTAEDWSAPPRVRAERAPRLLAWLEAQSATGRSMNQSLYALRQWLGGAGAGHSSDPAR